MSGTLDASSDSARSRLSAVVRDMGLAGVVLTHPGSVAWATGGMNSPIDRAASVDTIWIAANGHSTLLITTEVERDRLIAEHAPEDHGMDIRIVPWWDASAFVRAACDYLGSAPERVGSDGHPAFGHDLTVPLVRCRLRLDDAQQEQLIALGTDAAAAVEGALRAWRPGDVDRDVAAHVAGAVEQVGAQAPVLLVGGDERVRRFRHPVAVGDKMQELAMVVLVASRDGLHVALTRYAAADPVAPELEAALAATRRIHRRVLAASTPGVRFGAIMQELRAAYEAERAPDSWREHYQGGPIGYAQREFEIAPEPTDGPWQQTELQLGSAVAWNPSLRGGAKDEDTYLITTGQPRSVTMTTDWPLADDELPARPAVLRAAA